MPATLFWLALFSAGCAEAKFPMPMTAGDLARDESAAALVAYLALARTLYRLDYLTFIANNPAVRTRRQEAKAY